MDTRLASSGLAVSLKMVSASRCIRVPASVLGIKLNCGAKSMFAMLETLYPVWRPLICRRRTVRHSANTVVLVLVTTKIDEISSDIRIPGNAGSIAET
jgi:hypothetical protein